MPFIALALVFTPVHLKQVSPNRTRRNSELYSPTNNLLRHKAVSITHTLQPPLGGIISFFNRLCQRRVCQNHIDA